MQPKTDANVPSLTLQLLLLIGVLAGAGSVRGSGYPSNPALAQRLQGLVPGHEQFFRVRSVVKTVNTNDLWLVELGSGSEDERKRRPALLLVAGLEGNDLAGTVSALAWIEQLIKDRESDDSVRALFDKTTIYLFPRANPDGAARFFARPKFESAVNSSPVDDDHDGLVDEDGPDDLDGNGLITGMRVKDPEGEFIQDPAESRLLIKADRSKGEVGAWRLLTEGRDDDHDEAWNEDGVGGVNFNRNFPYNYRFFAPWAGRHQVSEPETRTLADFVIAHPNIGIIFTFGAADNLGQTPKGEAPKRPPVALHEEDVPCFRELGRLWRDTLGLKKELEASSEPGTFSDWMYFHRGRLSLAARPWSPALQLELAKAATKEPEEKPKEAKPEDKSDGEKAPKDGKDKAPPDTRGEEDRAFLKWIDANTPEWFVPWKAFDHPDFPGKSVEVGGFAPFARICPPEKLLDDLSRKHAKFLTDLVRKLPRVGIRSVQVKPLGESVFDVKLEVENTGYLPTALAQGELSREVHPTRVVLNLDEKRILSGTRRTMLGPIPGSGGMKEVRWVIHGKDLSKLDLEVVSMLGGTVQTSIELKGQP